MEPTDIAPVGVIQGTSRKESPFDTEAVCGSAASLPALIRLFQNFTAFQTTGTGILSKQQGRDTNLGGSTGALPQGYQLDWYEWRVSIRTLDSRQDTAANAVTWSELERIRQLGFVRYIATQSPLITQNLKDLVSYVDSMMVATTINATTVFAPNISSRGGKVVVVGGAPYRVRPQEQFEVNLGWPGSAAYTTAFTSTVPYYAVSFQDGILVRASA